MRLFSKLCVAVCSSSVLLLTGCQHFSQPNKVVTSPQVQDENNFSLQGKIGVRTPQQSGSAFFTWVQQQDQFDIELTGILGVGKTQIEGKPGQVTLNSAKTGLITAETPEELLEKATGWQAPIMHLAYWVQAKPATQNAQTSKDESNRLKQLVEDGWTVDFSYNDAQPLPNKLLLKQALADDKENRITMVIQNR
ncbi:outer-membrane lipoprotein LolB [Acinetobacter gyllenbergii]|uniref:Outer-membrane lipoprotein LolB n=1 Tax=Acinetobacter gyllenbergii CIP 110306 = MTCC 11365 TaxID=1217657 RepID=A0A829HEQ3_9GAMM|nr:lipoprotein insertase outer membrane protein LolB [Acinetobacter gyllenbergii]EPF73136.1 outer membrane lipoprotein LolB [Acinetobacter gyllenbergii CIP 110306 = MTCC 11365]EPH30803.1 Outer membrane lipoprotein LolB precursor [Acinetobacter gyllenbergii CIP 110306 = MTCC 11365]ESK42153.1 outer membrane lipoprotein LolB [Acinetobacter gyllenbergii NIPH 230]MCU4582986.1 lipoprotein insertase outer membrane protein LolB [Acinetobacter gyllenbergii]GMA11307.1 outer-membrane lipoprotein LolB [Ac